MNKYNVSAPNMMKSEIVTASRMVVTGTGIIFYLEDKVVGYAPLNAVVYKEV